MILPVALAYKGFCTMRPKADVSMTDNDDFLTCLKKCVEFQDIDLQDFDGNTCKMICPSGDNDPTNSLFIYTNEQGRFLYQITSASQGIFKNHLIWYCSCYKVENFDTIDDILNSTTNEDSVVIEILRHKKPEVYTRTRYSPTFFDSDVKDNFRPCLRLNKALLKPVSITDDKVCCLACLKIKCTVDPTGQNLTTQTNDGSFNFYFPIKIMSKKATYFRGYSHYSYITQKVSFYTYADQDNPTLTIDLASVISTYSEQIKSIEFLPFCPQGINFEDNIYYSVIEGLNETEVKVVMPNEESAFKATNLGLFVPYSQYRSSLGSNIISTLYVGSLTSECTKCGMRGYVTTPLGNFPLDFTQKSFTSSLDPKDLYLVLEDNGFSIEGFANAKILPFYLNFYTDNAGQVFIQNMTTNAQELRSINRQYEVDTQNLAGKTATQLAQGAIDVATSFVPSGILGTNTASKIAQASASVAKMGLSAVNEKLTLEREYSKSKAEYEDKIATQSLLGKLTGKQISGNASLSDVFIETSEYFYNVTIECNFALSSKVGVVVPQEDYDYSIPIWQNPLSTDIGSIMYEQIWLYSQRTYSDELKVYYAVSPKELFSFLLGYNFETKNFNVKWSSGTRFPFNLQFALLKTKGKSSNILNFPLCERN